MLCCHPFLVSITWITVIPCKADRGTTVGARYLPKTRRKDGPCPQEPAVTLKLSFIDTGREIRCRALKWWFRQTDVVIRCSWKHIKRKRTLQRYNLHWILALFSMWLGASIGSLESGSQKVAEPPRPLVSSTDTKPVLYLVFQINKIRNRWSLTHTDNSKGIETNWKILQHTWSYSQDCGKAVLNLQRN